MKILVLEDEDNIRELITYSLNTQGFETLGFEDSPEFYAHIDREALPDLVILDVMLPTEDGFSVLKKLRANHLTSDLPIIMLTAKSSEYHRIKGLDMGADDYIAKPFSILELISRIKAILRRYKPQEKAKETLTIAGLKLNQEERTVFIGEEKLDLTYKEFQLLAYMMENKGLVLTRDMIMNQVWGYDFQGETRTIDVHIQSLRSKLKSKKSMIKTVRNLGYKIGDPDE